MTSGTGMSRSRYETSYDAVQLMTRMGGVQGIRGGEPFSVTKG